MESKAKMVVLEIEALVGVAGGSDCYWSGDVFGFQIGIGKCEL